MNLRTLVENLAKLDLARVQHEALADQASGMAETVRQALDQAPGGPHDFPWRETGGLQASIGVEVDGLEAVVGTSDKAALYQEYGTPTVPPRPFLSPLADAHASRCANAIGVAVAQALRRL